MYVPTWLLVTVMLILIGFNPIAIIINIAVVIIMAIGELIGYMDEHRVHTALISGFFFVAIVMAMM